MIPDEKGNKCVSLWPVKEGHKFFLTSPIEIGESVSPSLKSWWTLRLLWSLDYGRSDSELWLEETDPFLPLGYCFWGKPAAMEEVQPSWEWQAVRRPWLTMGRGCVAERRRRRASPSCSSLPIPGIIPDSSGPNWGTPLTTKTEVSDLGPIHVPAVSSHLPDPMRLIGPAGPCPESWAGEWGA